MQPIRNSEPKSIQAEATNSRLRADIEAELEFEPSLDAASIGVTVEDGVATLTGHVGSYAEKIAAEHAVARVKCVRSVAEEIEVRLPSDVKHGDEEIARRALSVLTWGVHPEARNVQVKVQKGWLTLTGKVEWQYQKQSIENAMEWLGGITGVTNLINVKLRVAVGDVRERLTEAFSRNATLETSMINIAVNGGKVTLSGNVKSWSDRLTAANAAWAIPSVTEVIDELMVA